jgi:hypothetical protein
VAADPTFEIETYRHPESSLFRRWRWTIVVVFGDHRFRMDGGSAVSEPRARAKAEWLLEQMIAAEAEQRAARTRTRIYPWPGNAR